jgi:hypothetical protein
MNLPRLGAVLLIIVSSAVSAQSEKGRSTYDSIAAKVDADSPAYREFDGVFASTFVAADYEALARQLLLDALDLGGRGIGDDGVTYMWSAIHATLYKLSEVRDGGASLISLLEDERLPLHDGGESLTLCDAMLHRGREMLPLLAKVSKRNVEWARRCGKLIAEGRKTAF